MDLDFRVACGFFDHWKAVLLARKLGPQAVISLLRIWSFCRQWHPGDGRMHRLTDEQIEAAACWQGEAGQLVGTLVEVRLLDGEPGKREVHEWKEHQPWSAGEPKRIRDASAAGRKSAETKAQRLNATSTPGQRQVNATSTPRQPLSFPFLSSPEEKNLIPAPHPSVGSSGTCRADGATPATRPLQGRNAKPPDDPAEEPARRDRAARAGNGQTGPLLVLQPDNGAQKVSRLRGPDGELLRRFGAAHREEIGVPCRFAFARDRKIAQDLLGLYAPELLGDLVDAYWHEVHRYRQTPDEDRQPGIGASKLDFPGFSAQIPNLFRNYEFDSAKKGRPA